MDKCFRIKWLLISIFQNTIAQFPYWIQKLNHLASIQGIVEISYSYTGSYTEQQNVYVNDRDVEIFAYLWNRFLKIQIGCKASGFLSSIAVYNWGNICSLYWPNQINPLRSFATTCHNTNIETTITHNIKSRERSKFKCYIPVISRLCPFTAWSK